MHRTERKKSLKGRTYANLRALRCMWRCSARRRAAILFMARRTQSLASWPLAKALGTKTAQIAPLTCLQSVYFHIVKAACQTVQRVQCSLVRFCQIQVLVRPHMPIYRQLCCKGDQTYEATYEATTEASTYERMKTRRGTHCTQS